MTGSESQNSDKKKGTSCCDGFDCGAMMRKMTGMSGSQWKDLNCGEFMEKFFKERDPEREKDKEE